MFRINSNAYEISKASTMDMSIIRDLFFISMEAMEVLNTDAGFARKLKTAYDRLYPFHIGKYGQLQEWYKDYDDPKDNHRHLSHLYGRRNRTVAGSTGRVAVRPGQRPGNPRRI